VIRILNVGNIEARGLAELLDFCEARLQEGTGAFLVPMNPIKVIKARSSAAFQALIDRADWVFPDAWGIRWAARTLYSQEIAVTPGWRVMCQLMESAARHGRSVFLLGTRQCILEEAIAELSSRIRQLRVAGSHHGFFGPEQEEEVFALVRAEDPDYVFVAMGEKRQEEVIDRLRRVHPRAVFMGVGGSIDLIAGHQPMPPRWMRDRHLEWLFRAVRQPFRLPRFRALPVFVLCVLAEKIRRAGARRESC
jgi:N-acetylglucosaminyldiphosphoundecaprenol N-acetyl-beta-D-mannosaminyltransferase